MLPSWSQGSYGWKDTGSGGSYYASTSSYPNNSQSSTPTGRPSLFPPFNTPTMTPILCSPSTKVPQQETPHSVTPPSTATLSPNGTVITIGRRSLKEKREEHANTQHSFPLPSPLVPPTGSDANTLTAPNSGLDASPPVFPHRRSPSTSLDLLNTNSGIPAQYFQFLSKRPSVNPFNATASSMTLPSNTWNTAYGFSSTHQANILLQGTSSAYLTAPHLPPIESLLSSSSTNPSSHRRHGKKNSFAAAIQRPSTADTILLDVLKTQRQLTEKYYSVKLEEATTSWKCHIQRLHTLRLQQQRRAALNAQDAEGALLTAEMMEDIVAAVRDRQTDLTPHGHRAFIFPNQDVYEGSWKNARMHGKGLLRRKALKDLYEGQWFLGQRSGKGMYHNTFFQVFYTGSWIDNKRHGNGQLLEPEGLYTGDFHDNNIHGYGEYVYRDEYTYKGEWVNGLYDGVGTLVHANGTKYEGNWRKGYEHGKGTCSYANGGEVYAGDWRCGLRHGRGTYIAAGFQYEGEWGYGTVKGKGICQFADGSTYEGEWKNGKFHGFGCFTGPLGRMTYVGEFRDGKRHGRGEYNSPMVCYKGGWKDDKKHGAGIARVTGCGEFQGMWKEGNPDGQCVYFFWGEGIVLFNDGICVEKKEILRFRSMNCALVNGRAAAATSTSLTTTAGVPTIISSCSRCASHCTRERRRSSSVRNKEGKDLTNLLSPFFGHSTNTQPARGSPFWDEEDEEKEEEEGATEGRAGSSAVFPRRGSGMYGQSNIHLRRPSHRLTPSPQHRPSQDKRRRRSSGYSLSGLNSTNRSLSRNCSLGSGSWTIHGRGSSSFSNSIAPGKSPTQAHPISRPQ